MSYMIIVSFIFLNLFIAIILEGFAMATTEQNIRINYETIAAFTDAWTRYDKNATGMIELKDLKNIVLDICVEELRMCEKCENPSSKQNRLFNFHRNKAITLYTKWKREIIDDSPEFESFDRNARLKGQLDKYFDNFIGSLQVPVYNNFKHYNYYDVLSSFVLWTFTEQHRRGYNARQKRI